MPLTTDIDAMSQRHVLSEVKRIRSDLVGKVLLSAMWNYWNKVILKDYKDIINYKKRKESKSFQEYALKQASVRLGCPEELTDLTYILLWIMIP